MNDGTSNSYASKRENPVGKTNDKLEEYLAVMQPPKKSRTWADDTVNPAATSPAFPAEPVQEDDLTTELPQRESKRRKIEHPQEIASGASARPDIDRNADRAAVQAADQRNGASADEVVENDTIANDATGGEEGNIETKTDADWLRSKTSRLLGLLDDDEQAEMDAPAPQRKAESDRSDADADASDRNTPHAVNELPETEPEKPPEEEVDANIDMIRNTGRLFIRNLPYHADEAGLEEVFAPFGKLEEVSNLFHALYYFSSFTKCHHVGFYDDHPDRDIRCNAYDANRKEYFSRCFL